MPPPARAGAPAIARPRFVTGSSEHFGGTAFFLATASGTVVAVAAAHSFPLPALAHAGEVEFRLGAQRTLIARSTRFLSEPGLPFSAAGGTVRDDLMIFVLEEPPKGVRSLTLSAPAREGERVVVLGIPSQIPQDEDDLFGTVKVADPTRVEIELDVGADLRGWGGAPVLRANTHELVGILQAAWPVGTTLRVAASPVAGVSAALKRSLNGGTGEVFSHFVSEPNRISDTAEVARPASVWDQPRELLEHMEDHAKSRGIGDPLRIELEYPEPEAIVGDDAGAFVAGSAVAPVGDYRKIDVVFVLDTSGSTEDPSGADINGNGVIGTSLPGLGGLLGLGSVDPGDSVLAAEVASARHLVSGFNARTTRVALVTFAGESRGGPYGHQVFNEATTLVPLTSDYDDFRDGLDDVLGRGPRGLTHMAAGVDQATRELLGLSGGLSIPEEDADHIVIFLTDGVPTLPYGMHARRENIQAVLRAARRAATQGIRVFTYGIGEEALREPVAIVRLAEITDGVFTPVRDPADLVEVIEDINFGGVESVVVRNLTTGAIANQVQIDPDGGFSALVPVAPGKNLLRVSARSDDGREAEVDRVVHFAPDAKSPSVPEELVAARNRLLEQHLVELQRGRVELERERAEQAKRELRLEIEREREIAAQRAAKQRKELELEAERATRPESASH